MKVITIRQPWASLIVNNYKRYEFRTWKTKYRGKILIHAGMGNDKKYFERFNDYHLEYINGAIIGEAEIVDCILVDEKFSNELIKKNDKVYRKSVGAYAWKLENIKKYDKPIYCKGKLSFWDYELETSSDDIELIVPTLSHKDAWKDYINEFLNNNEKIIPFGIYWGGLDYDKLVRKIHDVSKGINVPPDKVVATTFLAIRKVDNKIIGAIDIRHRLNEYLLNYGGNIGYGIRPLERKKGYATKMLRLALEECKKLDIKKVFIVCDKENIASAKVIQNNGGTLEREFNNPSDNKIRQRYWIMIKES